MLFSENIKFVNNRLGFFDKHGNVLDFSDAMLKIKNRIINYWQDFLLFNIHLISFHVPFHSVRLNVFKLAGLQIGLGSCIHMGCKFFNLGNIKIGKDTIIGGNAFLDGRDKLIIGDHVDIASEVMIYNSEHDINDDQFLAKNDKVEIGDYVFIGPRAIILPGVEIGRGAVIAASAVVTKNVENYSIVAGIPANKIGERKINNPEYRLGRARLFQ